MAKRPRDLDKRQRWLQHFLDQPDSGLSIRAYCRQHQLSEPSFYAWRRALGSRATTSPSVTPPSAKITASPLPAFLPVRVPEETIPPSTCEIVLRGGRVLRVRPGFSADVLRQLVTVLEQLPC
jgi:transposase-like protein